MGKLLKVASLSLPFQKAIVPVVVNIVSFLVNLSPNNNKLIEFIEKYQIKQQRFNQKCNTPDIVDNQHFIDGNGVKNQVK